MNRLPDILSFVFGSMVTFLVPAIVWTVLVAGSYQLIREQIRRLRIIPPSSHELAHRSTS
jgi:hypothetical protein